MNETEKNKITSSPALPSKIAVLTLIAITLVTSAANNSHTQTMQIKTKSEMCRRFKTNHALQHERWSQLVDHFVSSMLILLAFYLQRPFVKDDAPLINNYCPLANANINYAP